VCVFHSRRVVACVEIVLSRLAILFRTACALCTPCRCPIQFGSLYESHVLFAASCQTRIFKGRSIPTVWSACIKGVPPRAFPKMTSAVGANVSPAFAAPAAWSMRANSSIPLLRIPASSRSIVWLGPKLLGTVVSPSTKGTESDTGIDEPGKEITINNGATPLCVVIGRGFGGYRFILRFALLL